MKRMRLFSILVLVLLLSACAISKKEVSTEDGGGFNMAEPAMDMAVEESKVAYVEESMEGYSGESPSYMDGNEVLDAITIERRIIKTGFIYMETLEYEETLASIKKLLNKYNAYTSYSESNGGSIYERGNNTRYARYTVKVPTDMFEEMYEELHTVGHVLNSSEGKEDVTSQFVDIEARLTTLEVQEDRLLAILEKTYNLEDVIELEYALQETRYEIERYTTNLRNLEDQVRYSTIDVNVQEVWEETEIEKPAITFGDRISEGLKETFEEISRGTQNLIIFLITQFPYLIFTLFIFYLCYRFYKRMVRKGELIKAEKEDNDQ